MNTASDAVPTPGRAGLVDLLGGKLCLDFVNTVEPRVAPRHGGIPREYLVHYSALIEWAEHVQVVTAEQGRRLLAVAEAQPDTASVVLQRALVLREAMYRIFFALSQGEEPASVDLHVLETAYSQAVNTAQLVRMDTNYTLAWMDSGGEMLERPIWPVAHSAIELLMEGDLTRVRDCPTHSDGCGWLFYDTSKNGSRRWCSMRGCGNEAKERRRSARKRSADK